MNKKMYMSFVFYITGTILVLVMSGIVITNFIKDASVFAEPVMVAVDTPAGGDEVQPELGADGSYKGTYVYRPSNDPVKKTVAPKKTAELTPDPTSIPTLSPTAEPTPSRTTTKPTATGVNPSPTTNNGTTDIDDGRIKIEVINYTGNERIAQDVKATLIEAGYRVSLRDEGTIMSVGTVIIERTEKADGNAVQSILKVGRVQRELKDDMQFDIVLILGSDLMP